MEWRDVVGYGGMYQVSDEGGVRNKRGEVLRPYSLNGYRRIRLYEPGSAGKQYKAWYVHRLVAQAFLGEPPEGRQDVDHLNHTPGDDRVVNLRWASASENALNRKEDARSAWALLTYDQAREIREKYGHGHRPVYRLIGAEYGVPSEVVASVLRGETYVRRDREQAKRVAEVVRTSRRRQGYGGLPHGSFENRRLLSSEQWAEIQAVPQHRGVTHELAMQYGVTERYINKVRAGMRSRSPLPKTPPSVRARGANKARPRILISLSEELLARVDAAAKAEHRSRTNLVERLIESGLMLRGLQEEAVVALGRESGIVDHLKESGE